MTTLFLLFNHTLTPSQEHDARQRLGIDRIEEMPQEIKSVWNAIDPEIASVSEVIQPVKTWLAEHASPGDVVLIQGDFGASYLMVKFAFDHGLIPVYSTTLRQAVELHQPDGTVRTVHQFKHHRFRRYGE